MRWTRLGLKLLLGLAVLVAVAAAVTLGGATLRERAALRDFPPLGQFVEVEGLRLHAVVAGEGPDLVLIHGSGANVRDYTFSLMDQLTDRYRVLVFDRPGLGHSDRQPRGAETIQDQARVLRLAAAELGAERPIVLGQSYGGAVALAWALDAPEAAAAVVSVAGPSHPWTTPLDPLYRVNSSWLGSAVVVPLITAFVSQDRVDTALRGIFRPQPVPDGYSDYIGAPLALQRKALRATAMQRAGLLDEITALAPRYASLAVPLEIVHGAADTTVSHKIHAEQMVRDTAQARLTVLDGIGHVPQHVAQDAVIAAIDRAAGRAGL